MTTSHSERKGSQHTERDVQLLSSHPDVLILEPNPSACAAIAETLEGDNISYECVTSLDTVRHHIDDLSPTVLIIGDGLSASSMLDLLTQASFVHGFERRIPVIILTRFQNPDIRHRALGLGAADVITTPFDPFELMLRVRNQLTTSSFTSDQIRAKTTLQLELKKATGRIQDAERDQIHRLHHVLRTASVGLWAHSLRVSLLAKPLAIACGADEDTATEIGLASLLLDIGKLSVPAPITGESSSNDVESIRWHTLAGDSMLSRSNNRTLDLARLIARSHHEHFDGSGVPDGLAGDSIPWSARIASIADAYMYRLSVRSSPTTLEPHEWIAQNRNSLFDPDIVEVFLAKLGQG